MKFLQTAIVITLPLIIILITVQLTVFDLNWYDQQFTNQGVYQNFEQRNVDAQINNLFEYLKGNQDLNTDFYTQREKIHLIDINNIFSNLKAINSLLILILIISTILVYQKSGLKKLTKTIFIATLISLATYFLFLFLLITNFDQLFLAFHQISFNNDYWQLDPNIDNLIILFPPELFANLVARIVKIAIITTISLLLISGIFLIKTRIRKNP